MSSGVTLSGMELVQPSAEYKDSFIDAVKEYKSEAETESTRRYRNLSIQDLETDFESFVERELSNSKGENLPLGYVPQTDYWLIDENKFVGRVSIRHEMTEHLLKIGGQIGYDIRPSKRRQGYGNKILELALPNAKDLGMSRVLVTSDVTNTASRKIIEKNGGVLENQVPNPETGVDKLRFWIDIK